MSNSYLICVWLLLLLLLCQGCVAVQQLATDDEPPSALNHLLQQAQGPSRKTSDVNARHDQYWDTAAQIVPPREMVQQMLEVQCLPGSMAVLLHYGSSYASFADSVRQMQLYAGNSNDSHCRATLMADSNALRVEFTKDLCDVATRSPVESFNYVTYDANISISLAINDFYFHNFSEIYSVSCVYPIAADGSKSNMSSTLFLYGQKYSKTPWSLPVKLELGNSIFLQTKPSSEPWIKDLDIIDYPINCWVAPSDQIGGSTKFFLLNGCPMQDTKNIALSQIIHMSSQPTPRLHIRLGTYLLVNATVQKTVYFHCQSLHCLKSNLKGIQNLPQCPSPFQCSGLETDVQTTQGRRLRHGVTGPVALMDARSSQGNEQLYVPCVACMTQRGNYDTQWMPRTSGVQHVVLQGMSTEVVVVIALISFVCGIGTMAGLWFIHVQTQPLRKKTTNIRTPPSNVLLMTDPTTATQTLKLTYNAV